MSILGSKSDARRKGDPMPYIINGERADVSAIPARAGYTIQRADRPGTRWGARFAPVNPILDAFRDDWGSEPNAYSTHEWLFQLARHWALWQSERMGTFPLDYRDPWGPVSREESEESGEDSVYWDISDAIDGAIAAEGGTPPARRWRMESAPGTRQRRPHRGPGARHDLARRRGTLAPR